MITLTLSNEEGRVLDQLRFDGTNVVYDEGRVVFVHHHVMQHRTREELWSRVAHAALWISQGKPLAGPGGSSAYYIVDDDLYRLERDPGETDVQYRERSRTLGCTDKGFVRLPRERPRSIMSECKVPFRDEGCSGQ
jgi:hypothetical protein